MRSSTASDANSSQLSNLLTEQVTQLQAELKHAKNDLEMTKENVQQELLSVKSDILGIQEKLAILQANDSASRMNRLPFVPERLQLQSDAAEADVEMCTDFKSQLDAMKTQFRRVEESQESCIQDVRKIEEVVTALEGLQGTVGFTATDSLAKHWQDVRNMEEMVTALQSNVGSLQHDVALLTQREQLQKLEERVLSLEFKLERKWVNSATGTNKVVTNDADSMRAQSGENMPLTTIALEIEAEKQDDASLTRLKSLEEKAQLSEKRLLYLENARILEELPSIIDRISAVEKFQKSPQDLNDAGACNTPGATKIPVSLQRSTTNDLAKSLTEANEYELQASVWDILLFCFTPEEGMLSSCFQIILAVINVAAQLTLLAIFNSNFLAAEIDDGSVQAAKHFRADVSHDIRFIDSQSQRTLGARICDLRIHDLQLELGAFQRQSLNLVDSFLNDSKAHGEYFNGQTMCLIGLACWTSTVLHEFLVIYEFAGAVAMLPRKSSGRTHIDIEVYGVDGAHRLCIRDVHTGRVIAVLMSVCARTVIAANLLVAGCWWLATTADIRELLLNAVALEFIMSIDEILYETFTSTHTRALRDSFAPLSKPPTVEFKGLELKKVLLLTFVPLSALFFYFLFTLDMVDDMRRLRGVLCDPPLGFAYGLDAFRFVHMAESDANVAVSAAAQSAVQEALDRGSGDLSNLTCSYDHSETQLSVKEFVSAGHWYLVDYYNPDCVDILGSNTTPPQVSYHFRELFQSTHCRELEKHCLSFGGLSGVEGMSGHLVRTFCPVTCGCDTLGSDLPVSGRYQGCPTSCTSTSAYSKYLARASCMNPSVSQLKATTYWPQIVQFLRQSPDGKMQELGSAMEQYGCNFNTSFTVKRLQTRFTRHVCAGSTIEGLKPIAVICPQTCQCDTLETSPLCEYGPTTPWCSCTHYLDKLLHYDFDSFDSQRCQELVCDAEWTDAEPFIASHYRELWYSVHDEDAPSWQDREISRVSSFCVSKGLRVSSAVDGTGFSPAVTLTENGDEHRDDGAGGNATAAGV